MISKILKLNLITLVLCLLFQTTDAQTISPNILKVLPPSPSLQQLERYGSYPVSLHTGIPNINIPIYEITTSRIKVPVSISFHASGFRPKELDGVLGLGWTLNAGGAISREVRGMFDDEHYSALPYFSDKRYRMSQVDSLNYTEAYEYLKRVEMNEQDPEYDIFSYNALGLSGKFIVKEKGQIVMNLNDSKSEKIIPHLNPNTKKIEFFDIFDETGRQYRFGKSCLDNTMAVENGFKHPYSGFTGWMLTDIVSSDKSDTVRFQYNSRFYSPKLFYNNSIAIYSNRTDAAVQSMTLPSSEEIVSNLYTSPYESLSIKRISFKTGHVDFNYSADLKFLNSAELYDKAMNLVDKTTFIISRYGGTNDNDHNKLDQIAQHNGKRVHKFSYYNEGWLPADADIGGSEDWWGYYNGAENGPSQIPRMAYRGFKQSYIVPPVDIEIGNLNIDRSANLHMRNFMLNKIIYPTGGQTEFVYETNKFLDPNGQIQSAGALRISEIINTSEAGKLEHKSYKYGKDECGYGKIFIFPDVSNLVSHLKLVGIGEDSSIPFDPHSYATIYNYTVSTISPTLPRVENYGMPIYYDVVTEYVGQGTVNVGKSISYFRRPVDDLNGYLPSFDHFDALKAPHVAILNSWRPVFTSSQGMSRGAQLLIKSPDLYGLRNKTEYYKNTGGTYSIIKVDSSVYKVISTKFSYDLNVNRLTESNSQYDEAIYYNMLFQNYYSFSTAGIPFSYKDSYIQSSKIQLLSTFEDSFESSGNVSSLTDFEYGTNHNYPKKIKKTSSAGKIIEVVNKYPQDKNLISGLSLESSEAIDTMVNRNMLNIPIEEELYVNSGLKSKSTVGYKIWDLAKKIIKPRFIDVQSEGYATERRIDYDAYDGSGNLLRQAKAGGAKISYGWNKSKEYPIAEISNALESEFFYEDFEGNGAVVSNYTAFKHTGDRAYSGSINLSNYFSPTFNGKSYRLTYYAYNGLGWDYTNTVYTGQVISGIIDDIRIYPQDAQLKTFTYKPLYGVTSETDAKGMTIYYEYDSFQRLKAIKDQDGNIIKSFDYQYKL